MATILEAIGAITGIYGAYLMSRNDRRSGWAYIPWTISSVSLTLFGIIEGYYWILALNLAFLLANVNGSINWLIKPRANGSGAKAPASIS